MCSLAGRGDNITEMRNPALLRILPWAKDTFKEVAKRMQVNRSMIPTICHGDVAVFNRAHIVRKIDGIPAIGEQIIHNPCRLSLVMISTMKLNIMQFTTSGH